MSDSQKKLGRSLSEMLKEVSQVRAIPAQPRTDVPDETPEAPRIRLQPKPVQMEMPVVEPEASVPASTEPAPEPEPVVEEAVQAEEPVEALSHSPEDPATILPGEPEELLEAAPSVEEESVFPAPLAEPEPESEPVPEITEEPVPSPEVVAEPAPGLEPEPVREPEPQATPPEPVVRAAVAPPAPSPAPAFRTRRLAAILLAALALNALLAVMLIVKFNRNLRHERQLATLAAASEHAASVVENAVSIPALELPGVRQEKYPGYQRLVFERSLFSAATRLEPGVEELLLAVAQALEPYAGKVEITVVGHTNTDKVRPGGAFRDNLDLALARGIVVLKLCQANQLLQDARAAGSLVAPFDELTPEDKALNRSVTLLIRPAP